MLPRLILTLAAVLLLAGCATAPPDLPADDEDATEVEYSSAQPGIRAG
jgi:starvation-inducible outer membrane lipoprotein